eukprot:jgi/Mesvir1/16589/Mv10124-RA.1
MGLPTDSEVKLQFEECFVLLHTDKEYHFFKLNPKLPDQGVSLDMDAIVRVRKIDLKINGLELLAAISNAGEHYFPDFMVDERVLNYMRKTGTKCEVHTFFPAKFERGTHVVSRDLVDKCVYDHDNDSMPVWIHRLLAQKLGEWIDNKRHIICTSLTNMIENMHTQHVRLVDPLGNVPYEMGLEYVTPLHSPKAFEPRIRGTRITPVAALAALFGAASDASIVKPAPAKGGAPGPSRPAPRVEPAGRASVKPSDARRPAGAAVDEPADARKADDMMRKRVSAQRPEEPARSTRARVTEEDMQRMHVELRMKEMQHQSDNIIRQLDLASEQTMRMMRFVHMLDMIKVFSAAEDTPGPIEMDAEGAERTNELFKATFFEAFGFSSDFVASSQFK